MIHFVVVLCGCFCDCFCGCFVVVFVVVLWLFLVRGLDPAYQYKAFSFSSFDLESCAIHKFCNRAGFSQRLRNKKWGMRWDGREVECEQCGWMFDNANFLHLHKVLMHSRRPK